jgi:hypothetical protein
MSMVCPRCVKRFWISRACNMMTLLFERVFKVSPGAVAGYQRSAYVASLVCLNPLA